MSVLVGKPAPDFSEKAVKGSEVIDGFTLSQFKGKYVVLFFYPLDFTFVCPTELHAFSEKVAEFNAKGAEVVAVSTDSWFSHLAWLETPKSKGGIEGVQYPIVSDFNKTISADYDVLLDGGMALRGLFLIDKEGIVQHQVVNNLPLGRNVDEALRMVDALQYFEENGEVCPANWNKGDKAMKPNADGLVEYFN
ncbi:MAG: peroxiredoxin [Lentisphaerales bacterium]|nr:peroxiredoxin [Lentisphaerales bacterium]